MAVCGNPETPARQARIVECPRSNASLRCGRELQRRHRPRSSSASPPWWATPSSASLPIGRCPACLRYPHAGPWAQQSKILSFSPNAALMVSGKGRCFSFPYKLRRKRQRRPEAALSSCALFFFVAIRPRCGRCSAAGPAARVRRVRARGASTRPARERCAPSPS